MTRSRRRYNRNRELGIKNRVRGIIKKAHDLAQCYGVDVDVHIQLENNFAAGYQSMPGLHTQRTAIPEDQLFGPEDFVSQNEKYHQLFSAQLPERSASALSSTSSASNLSLLPGVLPTRTNQSTYTRSGVNTLQFATEEVTPMSQLTPFIESKSPIRSPINHGRSTTCSTIRVSQATATPSLADTTPISIQQAKEIFDLVQKFF